MHIRHNPAPLAIFLLFYSCASIKLTPPHPTIVQKKEAPYHSFILISNTDEQKKLPFDSAPILRDLLKDGDNTILFLGNNSTKTGTPDTSSSTNPKGLNSILKARYEFFDAFKGDKYFVTGQDEWDKGGRQGETHASLLEYYVENILDLGNVYSPDNGCPGPTEIDIGDDIVLLLINTQWWLHNWERPGKEDGCEVDNEPEFLANLEDAIKRNYNKKIIVAGHHSITSSGIYGGYFPLKSHIFPFTLANENLYIPLPILGSAYILNRHFLGEHQDLKNHKYHRMINSMMDIFSEHKNLIYVSGHDKILEYDTLKNIHAINSGSFSKSAPLNNKKAIFASSNKGLAKLDFYENGEVWLRFYSADSDRNSPVFEKLLFQSTPYSEEVFQQMTEKLDYADSTITTFITKKYEKKNKKPGPLGNNYREEWRTPVSGIRYFDMGVEKEGMKIKKKGGGMQTKSLRLESENDKEYVLRSVEKFPENAVPAELRGTFAENLISEQISASHPYAAFAIPKLADAAGIYHTNPELVYLPDDPRLEIYRETFGGNLYLYEERPDDDRSDVDSFGNSKDIISTNDVIKKMLKDGDHVIDQGFVVRSRLFDILIGDWDRHEDQWRWAKFKGDEDIKIYRPIPRDRDQAFFWSNGWLMKLISQPWGMPKFQGFHHKISNVDGLNFNARYFDRTFMNQPELDVWIKMSRELQDNITNEVIENAIKDLPPEIYKIHGETIISKLKSRRDDLSTYARQYYLFLAQAVDVLGTNKRDRFEVERLNDNETKVTAYRISKKKEEVKYKLYERIFKSSETKEIRLYGLGDDDIFNLTGEVDKGIKVRIIGGSGDDVINNNSRVKGAAKKTWVYDTRKNTEINASTDTKNKTSNRNKDINQYDRKAFQYPLVAPILFGGYNPDDGLFIGLGGIFKTHGFRKYPFKTNHFITGVIAPKSASFNINYTGTFTEVIQKWSLNLHAGIYFPSYSDFFYGLGNETQFDKEIIDTDNQYYAARYRQILLNPELFRSSRNEKHHFAIGLKYQLINVKSELNESEDNIDRFINQYARRLDYPLLDAYRSYIGSYVRYSFDTRNSKLYPQNGMYFDFSTGYARNIDDNPKEVNFSHTQSRISFYYTFGNTFKTTLALRAGGEINEGDYEFYQANTLGGAANLRGFRKQRFAGDMTFYQNTELRIRLFTFKTIVLPGDAGLVFFHDVGRVWMDEDPSVNDGDSNFWHRGYGMGVFVAPFQKAAITFDYSRSNTSERAFFIRLGFLF